MQIDANRVLRNFGFCLRVCTVSEPGSPIAITFFPKKRDCSHPHHVLIEILWRYAEKSPFTRTDGRILFLLVSKLTVINFLSASVTFKFEVVLPSSTLLESKNNIPYQKVIFQISQAFSCMPFLTQTDR